MHFNRREFFKICAGGMAGTTVAALGFSSSPVLAATRQYKLLRAKETRNNCTYCSVGCGMLIYSRTDNGKNTESSIFHIEGDPDHPVSRGSLCPKGAGVLDFIKSDTRQKYPEVREPGQNEWKRISWDEAFTRIARHMKDDRDKNFLPINATGVPVNRWLTTGILITSAASNEMGWLAQKVTRALGMLSVDTQARVCHGPSVSSLAATFGRGAMTNNWVDIKNANVILVMGGNSAEAHPVGFRWAMEAKIANGAKLIVIDPRFTRTAAVADFYAPIRAGSDITFLSGILNYLITQNKINLPYILENTNASFLVDDNFTFEEGLFSGYQADKRNYDKSSWSYQLDGQGFAKRDLTLQHPRTVWNLLKQHVSRYTPEVVNNLCGTSVEDFLYVCEQLASTCGNDRTATVLYALGWTQHSVGSQNIRTMAMIQLLLGNIGVVGGGVNALRGHSNIQGLTDVGLLSTRLPAYLDLPSENQVDLTTYLQDKTPKPFLPNQTNYWGNYPKFFVSLMKTLFGDYATKENDWAYHLLPKWDKSYDLLQLTEMMQKGQMTGYICQGFNPIAAFPDKAKIAEGLAKLKFLVCIDPLQTETASFWQNHDEYNNVDPSLIQTEVFRLPSSCFAEEEGSIVNSARWLQWHWSAAKPPAEAKHDTYILANLFLRLKKMYQDEGGADAEAIENLQWDYANPWAPNAQELAKEANGKALEDIKDDKGNIIVPRGQQLSSFAQLKDDGTTASGIWIFCGSWTDKGNQMARRDNADPSGLGATPGWAWAWPLNRRILYNRASADKNGQSLNPARKLIEWDGQKWTGIDIPDYTATAAPELETGAFIMNAEGVGRLFCEKQLIDGPFPEHYEPFESPISTNPLHPNVISNPAARVFDSDLARMGSAEDYPHVATTYALTEHFHFWTQHSLINCIAQPEQFIEIGETLAKKKRIKQGDMVKVSSNRGYIKAKAVVTKRLRTLTINGKEVDTIGIPIHGGYQGAMKKGFIINTLTPFVGDANSQTPEYKAFLVNVEKA